MTDTQDERLALVEKERFLFECASNSYFRAGKTSNPQHWMEAAMLAQQHRNALAALRTPPAREREAIEALERWLVLAGEELAEFDVEECDSVDLLCPKCRNVGCINLLIRETHEALSAAPTSPVPATNLGAGALAVSRPNVKDGSNDLG